MNLPRVLPLVAGPVAAVCACLPPPAAAQETRGRGLESFPRTGAKNTATEFLPQAVRTWTQDGARESRKERNFWAEFRRKEKARLLGIQRAETRRIVEAARARAAAYSAFVDAERPRKSAAADAAPGLKVVDFPQPPGWPPAAARAKQAMARAQTQLESAATAVGKRANSLAESIEQNLPGAKNGSTRTASIVIALLVIFLVPSLFVILLAFGVIKLRGRRRLPARVRRSAV